MTSLIRWTSAAALVVLLGACTEHEIQYVETPVFNPPPDAAAGYLGYYTPADKQTTCGNCHADMQASWVQTKHASAWADLQASGHADAMCEGCHTVSDLGNAVDSAAGHNKVADTAYFDVQCESCHGPGLAHVESVFGGSVVAPLAAIAVGIDSANGCGECHTDVHHPFIEEWSQSRHGYGGDAYLAEGSRDPCMNCHEGRAAIRVAMSGLDPRPSGQTGGDPTVFLEKDIAGDYQPIVCAVCHDPHDATNEGQLRRPLDESSLEQLCARCHSREGEPGASGITRRGPHGAQGSIVMDEEAGWLPPNWPYTDRVVGSHTTANPRQCAACHVAGFAINAADSTFVKNYVGHTFQAVPCINQSTGEPIPGADCPDSQRDFRSCAVSGCHGSADAARTAFQVVRARMNSLTDALWTDVDNDSLMESTDRGVLPEILAQAVANNERRQINLYDSVLTPAEGAIWNAQLAATSERPAWLSFKVPEQYSCASQTCTSPSGGSNTGHISSGQGAHNPFLLEALLLASIDYLRTYYNVPAPPVTLSQQLTAPAGLRKLR